jgi:hypothetical protein
MYRATRGLRLIDHKNREACAGEFNGGGHAGKTGADHKDQVRHPALRQFLKRDATHRWRPEGRPRSADLPP